MLVILTIIGLLPATEICAAVICCQSVSDFTMCLRDQVAQVLQLNSKEVPESMQRLGYSFELDGK